LTIGKKIRSNSLSSAVIAEFDGLSCLAAACFYVSGCFIINENQEIYFIPPQNGGFIISAKAEDLINQ
jgi:hypothetical protein